MELKPLYQSCYTRLDVELGKNPVLVKSMVFYGSHGERLKTLVVSGYKEMEGKWLATDMGLSDTDSLSNLRMRFKNFSFIDPGVVRKVQAHLSIARRSLVLPIGAEGSADEDALDEGSNEARN
jgi:hypothetical protein